FLYLRRSALFLVSWSILLSTTERNPAILVCSVVEGRRTIVRAKSSFPRVLFRPAPPGDASSSNDLPLFVRNKSTRKSNLRRSALGLNIGKRCDAIVPSSYLVVFATACSQAKTIFRMNKSGSTQKTRLLPSSLPVTGFLCKI